MFQILRKHILPFAFFLLVSVHLTVQASSTPETGYPLSKTELDNSLEEIRTLVEKGSLGEAKERYQTLIQYDLPTEDRLSLEQAMEELNIKILFSPLITPDSFSYTVEPGDSLYKIAKEYHTTVDLIKKSNLLADDSIRPGMSLKISKAVYSIVVDISENHLKLYSDQELLKTYPVATGRKGHKTPAGTFTIVNKLIDPTWYKAGAVVPPESPDNILGTRWLGFSLATYGIHGTTLPETIGTHVSEGCIRMMNHDVEELYAIVPLNTTVTVTE